MYKKISILALSILSVGALYGCSDDKKVEKDVKEEIVKEKKDEKDKLKVSEKEKMKVYEKKLEALEKKIDNLKINLEIEELDSFTEENNKLVKGMSDILDKKKKSMVQISEDEINNSNMQLDLVESSLRELVDMKEMYIDVFIFQVEDGEKNGEKGMVDGGIQSVEMYSTVFFETMETIIEQIKEI